MTEPQFPALPGAPATAQTIKESAASMSGNYTERTHEQLAEIEELGAQTQALLAAFLVDGLSGSNEYLKVVGISDVQGAIADDFIARGAPPMIARMAQLRLNARSDPRKFLEPIIDILKGPKPAGGAGGFLKKMFGGGQ